MLIYNYICLICGSITICMYKQIIIHITQTYIKKKNLNLQSFIYFQTSLSVHCMSMYYIQVVG